MTAAAARGSNASRRLHRGHFAFMRALIQGMEERAAWERYLQHEGEGGDRRRIRSTIHWIRDTFAAAARRERRPGVARLIHLDAARVAQRPAPRQPSLEEFALEQGLEDFSEDEQIEAYAAAYPNASQRGPGAGGNRRARLIERQLEALRWLEHLVVHDPEPGDAVEAWLNPTLAARLHRAGIHTMHELVETMNRTGARWWTRVPGIGVHKAARIADWLRAHAAQLKLPVSSHALVPRTQVPPAVLDAVVAPATAIRPLEKFLLPADLDGRAGLNRETAATCLTGARDDREAVLAWIAERAAPKDQSRAGQGAVPLSATQRSYRKEAERLLLWSVLERGKSLSSLDAEDATAFIRFLAAPPAEWCGPRANPRWSPLWRPLEGPLSASAQRQAIVILHGLFASLVRNCYLRGNPFRVLLRSAGRISAVAAGGDLDEESVAPDLSGPCEKQNRLLAMAGSMVVR
ncbi:phage integrase family protein [Variovorax ureilyticus]|uniref:Phage integrase family protein n=1 Tax=Variovorax ureilyticus TaxID=1836198 RepID=A0ABU8VRC7_9BURK